MEKEDQNIRKTRSAKKTGPNFVQTITPHLPVCQYEFFNILNPFSHPPGFSLVRAWSPGFLLLTKLMVRKSNHYLSSDDIC
ncbi:MAG: hypothetical protein IPP17_13105 [Bacteroidetes bacterium]|nr:hypothetical protein [Bacteroidota bacterium]